MTADGSVIVGNGGVAVRIGNTNTNGSRAFRWSQSTGLVPLGPLAGDRYADAAGISDNGKIVVGTSSTGPLDRFSAGGLLRGGGTAFRWTEAAGMQDLRQLLVAAGVDMTGINPLNVTGMSPDGQWIVGQASTASAPGETVGYLVQYCDDAIGAACVQSGGGAAAFAVAASATTLNVAAGQSASTTLTITPTGGFNAAVSFACSGLPTGASCSFAPASVTPAASAVSTTLTISTNGAPVALWVREHSGIALALLLPVLGRWRSGGRPGARRCSAWLAIALITAWLVGCGGGGGGGDGGSGGGTGGGSGGGNPPPPPATGTPAGTSTVTVTATSGSGAAAVSRTVTLSLTVTR